MLLEGIRPSYLILKLCTYVTYYYFVPINGIDSEVYTVKKHDTCKF